MSPTSEVEDTPRDGNNPAPRSSQNKPQLLQATMRNVPKLKELNYIQWKNVLTNSIKNAKLWGYVDGSIMQPSEENHSDLENYFEEAGAVRNAILGSLEPRAQMYIEEDLDPRDAWLTLEKKYLTSEVDTDAKLASIEKELANLRLEEEGDIIEHIAEFCRMRSQLNGTRFGLDEQASVIQLYRSLPPNLRQLTVTSDGTELKDLNTLCARLSYLSQNPVPEAPVDEPPSTPAEDYSSWGVPEDIKLFGLTGNKNPLLEERASITCRDCLLKDHKAGTPECPQYEWRRELWGTEPDEALPRAGDHGLLGSNSSAELHTPINRMRLTYEFSEPVKVILDFNELELKSNLRGNFPSIMKKPSAIQQCAILPIINGRNVLARAPRYNGKTTALVICTLQIIDTTLPQIQALVFTSASQATSTFQSSIHTLGANMLVRCSSKGAVTPLGEINNHHILVGTPEFILGLLRRNFINTHKLRIVVLDDIDKLMENGMEDQILEVYRRIPPLTQVIASSTTFTGSIAKTASQVLADPLQITVSHCQGVSIGTLFYVTVPANEKCELLAASFSTLGVGGVVVLCHDAAEITRRSWEREYSFYHLPVSDTHGSAIQSFSSRLSDIRSNYANNRGFNYDDYVRKVALIATDATSPTPRTSSLGVPIINYDIPNNVEDFLKRFDQWRTANPGQNNTILTFVTADTDEINTIRDLERHFGVHLAEMVWEGGKLI